MLTLQAIIGGTATGPIVGAAHPTEQDRDEAGDLMDMVDYHPSYYFDPLPLPPRIDLPRPALGRIVWPSWGLARYAVGHLLMDPDALAELEAETGFDGSVQLVLSNYDGDSITLAMRISARRPLNDPRESDSVAIAPSEGQRVPWVVTLVDYRYDVAGVLYEGDGATAPETWGTLIEELGAEAGYSFSASEVDGLCAAFPVPDEKWWGRDRMNGRPVTLLIDAACAAVGLRVAVDDLGEAWIEDAATASDTLELWWAVWGDLAGGGGRFDLDRERPLNVAFAFDGGPVISDAMPSGVAGTLSISLQPDATGVDYADAYLAALDGWFSIDPVSADFRGHVPADFGSVGGFVVHDTDKNITAVVREPVWYPWPLVGTPTAPDSATGGYYPGCGGSGSSGGSGADPCVTWYTNYLHLGAVAVSPGESLRPGQLVGYIGYYADGSHLHFSLGDGKPLIFPGYAVPIVGRTVDVTGWLGYPVIGPRAGCERGSMGPADFTTEQLAFIESAFTSPLRATGLDSYIISKFHCDYEYEAVDISRPPITDQAEVGTPVYAAIGSANVLTTVETVSRHPAVGYAVQLKHQTACCQDPGDSGGDPHETGYPVQWPGLIPPVSIPPSGVPYPHQPGSFEPVTRICISPLPALSVVGQFNDASEGPIAYVQLDPEQFEFFDGRLRIKPSLVGGVSYETTGSGSGGSGERGEAGLLPLTVEKTAVTVPAGMLIGETTCSPWSTSCCNGPNTPCVDFDPILPVELSAPVGIGCAEVTLYGTISWRDGEWKYEGFVAGVLADGTGIIVDSQLEYSEDFGAWVFYGQFLGVGDVTETLFFVALADCGMDVLCGAGPVDRPNCSGTATVTVGNPCPVGGSGGSGSGSGSGGGSSGGIGFVSTACGTVSRTLRVEYSTGEIFNMEYSDVDTDLRWEGYTGSFCDPGAASLTMRCIEGNWVINAVASFRGPAGTVVVPASTFPFSLTYTGPESGLCGGSVSFTVGEAP